MGITVDFTEFMKAIEGSKRELEIVNFDPDDEGFLDIGDVLMDRYFAESEKDALISAFRLGFDMGMYEMTRTIRALAKHLEKQEQLEAQEYCK